MSIEKGYGNTLSEAIRLTYKKQWEKRRLAKARGEELPETVESPYEDGADPREHSFKGLYSPPVAVALKRTGPEAPITSPGGYRMYVVDRYDTRKLGDFSSFCASHGVGKEDLAYIAKDTKGETMNVPLGWDTHVTNQPPSHIETIIAYRKKHPVLYDTTPRFSSFVKGIPEEAENKD